MHCQDLAHIVMLSPRRAYPYFKVQVFDDRSMTWIEKKQGFDTPEEARKYANDLPPSQKVRIVLVDERGYHELDE